MYPDFEKLHHESCENKEKSELEELIDYKNNLQNMSLEDLLNELEKQSEEKQLHSMYIDTQNDKLDELLNKKILFIKMQIIESFK